MKESNEAAPAREAEINSLTIEFDAQLAGMQGKKEEMEEAYHSMPAREAGREPLVQELERYFSCSLARCEKLRNLEQVLPTVVEALRKIVRCPCWIEDGHVSPAMYQAIAAAESILQQFPQESKP